MASFEKMGAVMAENDGKVVGIDDELSTFLLGINLYSSIGLSESHDLRKFLQLYNGFLGKGAQVSTSYENLTCTCM